MQRNSLNRKSLFGGAGLWPTISAPRPRGDNTPPAPAPDADPSPAIDLNINSPAIQAAIREAAQKAVGTAQGEWEKERAAILGSKTQILDEKKKLEDLFGGAKPEDIAARLKKFDEIEAKDKAGEHGRTGEEWLSAVETEAQKKQAVWKKEQEEVIAKDKGRISELEGQVAEVAKAAHRAWCSYRIALAAMPEDHRFIQPGAEEMLMDRLVGIMERYEGDGVPEAARFKVGGTLLTGSGPGGYMTDREFLDLARQGKIPGMPQLQFLFVSSGQGSNTTTPDPTGAAAAGGNWWKMTEPQRDEYVRKHGSAAARTLMDSSPRAAAAA